MDLNLVLHHYKLTRFSNLAASLQVPGGFYTITNLQGSQTVREVGVRRLMFYTITNLQGSQTNGIALQS